MGENGQSKSIFKSKRFWVNVAGAVLEGVNAYARIAPGGTVATVALAGNIVMRRFLPDEGEVHVVTPRPVAP